MDKAELMTRYDRQMRLEGWNQQKLSVAKVLVAGIGALGCEVAKNLALMGVGELLLVDNDVVELSNLSRQMLYNDSDISQAKALVAEKRIAEMNPLVKVRGI
ncbi:MAG: ThiF family adenylyltransferase, partial [Candidatus Caldarchaeum sp.]|nr:ThiF family adenylyltransferase [Candidatus Caldarchaeum sp.]MDW8435488.1 ThiF family adenylyltransferase [Candidatus Caldarchaeum sp.]